MTSPGNTNSDDAAAVTALRSGEDRMRALVIESYKSVPQGLAFRDDWTNPPKLKSHEVLVKVRAAGINPVDWKTADGMLKQVVTMSLPRGIGYDISGSIVELGGGVTSFNLGDSVIAQLEPLKQGALQEYAVVEERLLAKMPMNLSFEEAAAIPLAAQTAVQCMEQAGLDPEADNSAVKAFVPAGLGGVGMFATQILEKVYNVQVATTVSTAKVDKMKQLVPRAQVIDYRTTDYTTTLKDIDFILDTTGDLGNEAKILKKGGKVTSIAAMPDPSVVAERFGHVNMITRPVLSAATWYSGRKIRNAGGDYQYVWVDTDGGRLQKIATWIEQEKVQVVIDKVFDWNDAKQAFVRSKEGPTGKVVVKIDR